MSSSRRFTQTGSATVPRRPSRSRVTRCRTSVTIWLARATRCHLSTAIVASGQRGPDPGRVRRRRVDHHDLDRRPGTRRSARPASPARSRRCGQEPTPAAIPARRREQSTKRGQPRIGALPGDRRRGSSGPTGTGSHRSPTALVGSGSGSQRAAAATSALCAVGHDTPYSRGDLGDRPVAAGDRDRHLVPQPLGHPAPRPDRRRGLGERPPRTQRLDAEQTAFPPPQLDLLPRRRQILDPAHRPVLHRAADNTPQAGHGPSRDRLSMITFTCRTDPVDAAARRTRPPDRTTLT